MSPPDIKDIIAIAVRFLLGFLFLFNILSNSFILVNFTLSKITFNLNR